MGDFVGLSSEIEDVARGFDRPGQYSYEIAGRERSGSMGWDVSERSDGDVVVGFRYELDGQAFDRTVIGSSREVCSELLATPARAYLRGGLY
ncbi:hypothetical protein [Halococcus agarilyticus]|uniref:hypothetical protein n=1 Tax=Halococcus agarilyticus TaxID=1232219 RepID=UPI0018964127|nr:hypothetical protein [Halococcus agarilyticus]